MGYACLYKGWGTILNEPFGESKIDYIDKMWVFASSHEKIIRFDISMEYIFLMQKLNSIDYLLTDLKDSFQW